MSCGGIFERNRSRDILSEISRKHLANCKRLRPHGGQDARPPTAMKKPRERLPVNKPDLRKLIQSKIEALGERERLEKSRLAVSKLLNSREFLSAQTVVAYDSFGTEAGVHELLESCIRSGRELGLPRIHKRDHGMTIYAVKDLRVDLENNRLGFREPVADLPEIPVDKIGLIVVPGIAFDLAGNRLGRGSGYYDRFLASAGLKAVICAVAFECQVLSALPAEKHDKRIHILFTENRVIRLTS